MQEHELKAVISDAEAFRTRVAAAGLRLVFEGEMRDRKYDRRRGRLQRRDEVLRVRTLRSRQGTTRTVFGWKGPAREQSGFKVREEYETGVEDASALHAILSALGYRPVRAIDRWIEVWEGDGVTVRLEHYPALDLLAEVEGEVAAVEALLPELGLPRDAWLPHGLPWFVKQWEERTGREARLAAGDAQ